MKAVFLTIPAKRILQCLVCLCFLKWIITPVIGRAQSHVTLPATFWSEMQLEYVLRNNSYFFFRNQYRFSFDDNLKYLGEQGPFKNLERIQVRVGYEHALKHGWSAGVTQAYAFDKTRKFLFNELYARHLSLLGKFRFTKRASYEHILRWPTNTTGRVRLRADFDRNFKIGKDIIRPRLAYEFFYNINYHPVEQENTPQRLIDRTRLRAEVMYAFTRSFSTTAYFIEQTDYLGVKPAYNASGAVVKPASKRSTVAPTFGLDFRYVFFQGAKQAVRAVPSDPSK
jgi:hypothetical protein